MLGDRLSDPVEVMEPAGGADCQGNSEFGQPDRIVRHDFRDREIDRHVDRCEVLRIQALAVLVVELVEA